MSVTDTVESKLATEQFAEIREDIADLRHELGDAIAAVGRKFERNHGPRARVYDVKDTVVSKTDDLLDQVKHATPDAAGQAVGKAKDHPRVLIVLAAVGAVLAALGFARR